MTQEKTEKTSWPARAFKSVDNAMTRLLHTRPALMVALMACIGAGVISGHLHTFEQLPADVAGPIRTTFFIIVIFIALVISVLAFTLGRLGYTLREVDHLALLAETATSEVETQSRARIRVEKRLVDAEARLETSQATVEQWADEVERANAKLRKVDAVKTRFLSQVAHELRGPISAIVSAAKIIQKHHQTKPEVVTRFSATIVTEGDRLNHVINDFVDLAKIESGCVQWQIDNVDIGEMINRALLSVEPLALESGLILDADLEENLPVLRTDPDRIAQVLSNLLLNAIKQSTTGGTVKLQVRRKDQFTRFEVTDSGAGIAADEMERVFDRFHRASIGGTGINGKRAGTGLGLAISKEVVEHCGGRIWVESSLGKGSTFAFTLPDDTSLFIREHNQVLSVTSDKTLALNVAVVTRDKGLEQTLLRIPRGRGIICRAESDARGLGELLGEWHADCVVASQDVFEDSASELLAAMQAHGFHEILVYSENGQFTARSVRDNSEIAVRRLRYLVSHGSTVLVVEDDDNYRGIVTFELEQAGYKVVAVRDGQEALDTLAEQKVDAIMLDVVVPRIDGLTVLRQLNEAGVRIPTVLLTGVDDPEVELEAKELGALEVVHKHGVDDVSRAAVLARVQRLLAPVFTHLATQRPPDAPDLQPSA
jgi:signal transduction histidine kinase/ActR/RegA family two-component response regulator